LLLAACVRAKVNNYKAYRLPSKEKVSDPCITHPWKGLGLHRIADQQLHHSIAISVRDKGGQPPKAQDEHAPYKTGFSSLLL
jgi:hypothetical protein